MSTLLQWGLAGAILLSTPLLIRLGVRHSRGRGGAAILLLGLAFGSLFDPARAEAMETIDKRRDQRSEAGNDGA
ncbi:hypothetical protein [Sphingomonas azotifigens]|uniref:hypothetical protein n=1 Tax=Sphingomonas azotifigens TaxID=330920 RepID=UPI0009FD8A73|nr:hypothetical protein [Sphingomonas azotifigens]